MEIPDLSRAQHYNLPSSLGVLNPDRVTGQERRFACKCGMKSHDPVEGMMHTFAELEDGTKHGVYLERFSLGMWHYDRQSVGKRVLERMRRKGETVADFARRITRELNRATAALEGAE